MKAGCLTKKSRLEMPEEGSYVHGRGVAKCIWYSTTTIRGCGLVDTIYQVVNSTCGSIHMGFFNSSNR